MAQDGQDGQDGRRAVVGARLLDEAIGYAVSAALRAVAACGVADRLAHGPRTAGELAAATGLDEGSLYRVLRLLATREVFTEDPEGRFALTEAGGMLRGDVPGSLRDAVLMLTDRTFWEPAGRLDHCLRTGGSAFTDVFGRSFFDHFAQDAATAAVFHDGMAAMSSAEDRPIADAYGFPETGPGAVVDIGGGQGGFLAAALRCGKGLTGTLYDRGHVLAGHGLGAHTDLTGRWSTEEGDFFEEVPSGDFLVLKRILHDWSDEECVRVLSNCRRALAPGGRVLVVDAVLVSDGRPHQGKTLDLLMMASLTGRERTREEFRELFAGAGLRLTRVVPTPAVLSVVEAVAA
ncbi:O-methyltransferase [Streptomyces inusitatus]|uniref:O-methyltransferase n=1 Tax=Streptomyces inusitatus TaxID=68221 RepID=A0A918PXE5_9ACTN|nr:methyltransferase [Streptomyces inusitatus]GGZ24262.1 O-methyltransferase [Streptomyces inusitatus]